MVVTIRTCIAADARALALVGKATFLETYAGALDLADVLAHCDVEHGEARYAAWLTTPGYQLWIAEVEGGAPVGYAVVGPNGLTVDAGVGDLELKRIYLLHRFEGTGLGKRLLHVAIAAATATGAQRLMLGVFDRNPRAIAFYGRHGFNAAGTKPFQVGSKTYEDLVLSRPL